METAQNQREGSLGWLACLHLSLFLVLKIVSVKNGILSFNNNLKVSKCEYSSLANYSQERIKQMRSVKLEEES